MTSNSYLRACLPLACCAMSCNFLPTVGIYKARSMASVASTAAPSQGCMPCQLKSASGYRDISVKCLSFSSRSVAVADAVPHCYRVKS
jgi:hypothetical protein